MSRALARRRRRSLDFVTASAGACGAVSAVLVGALVIALTGGGSFVMFLIALFFAAFGALGGLAFGRLARAAAGREDR